MKFNTIWVQNTSISKVFFLIDSKNAGNFFRIMIPICDDLPDEIEIINIDDIDQSGNFMMFYNSDYVSATLIPNKVCFSTSDLKETIEKFREMFNETT